MGYRRQKSKVNHYIYDSSGCRWAEGNTQQSQTPPKGSEEPSPLSTISHEEYYNGKTVPQSTVDVKGPQYFMITLDDYNNNKPKPSIFLFF